MILLDGGGELEKETRTRLFVYCVTCHPQKTHGRYGFSAGPNMATRTHTRHNPWPKPARVGKPVPFTRRQRPQGFCRVLQRPGENLPWVSEGKSVNEFCVSEKYNKTDYITRWWECSASWWSFTRETTNQLSLCSPFLLCGDNLCSLWCCCCLDKVWQGWVTNKYSAVLTKGLSDRRISTCIYLHWQSMSCPAH